MVRKTRLRSERVVDLVKDAVKRDRVVILVKCR